jgi:hypothetical protein
MTELPFSLWREELEGEIERARAELAEAESGKEAALFALRAANAEKAAIAKAFARLGHSQVAGPLQGRRRGYEAELDRNAAALTRANNCLIVLRTTLADRELALQQLEIIAPADDETSEAA